MSALAKLYFGWTAYFKSPWQAPPHRPPPDLLVHFRRDGITLLSVRCDSDHMQCIIAATDQISPQQLAQRVKGRWDHACRAMTGDFPGFTRHFFIRSLGQNTTDVVSHYIQSQIDNSELVDPLYRERLKALRFHQEQDARVKSSHNAVYDVFLHMVLVTADRYRMASTEARTVFGALRDGMRELGADPYEASMMPDHAHCMARWPTALSAAALMDAIKRASGRILLRSAFWSGGGYMGTVGPYRLQGALERNRGGGWVNPVGLV